MKNIEERRKKMKIRREKERKNDKINVVVKEKVENK